MHSLSARQAWINTRRRGLGLPVAGLVTTAVLVLFLAVDTRMWHWFVIPTYVCGLLIGVDAGKWFSGEYELFDPKGIAGIFGWQFFFLAPLLFVASDAGLPYGEPPPDWRPWVGVLSIINASGLILYQFTHYAANRKATGWRQKHWTIAFRRFWWLFVVFVGVALVSQGLYFVRSGGFSGILERTASIRETGQVSYDGGGLGLFAIAGQSLPMLLLIVLTVWRLKRKSGRVSGLLVVILLCFLAAIQFVSGGLEGSRSTTVVSLLWFIGILHHFWRPFSRHELAVGLLIVGMFLYLYGFYKSLGVDAWERLAKGEPLSALEQDSGRTLEGLFLGDLSRTSIQSYLIFKLNAATDYNYRMGGTYLSALLRPIPSWIWPERPIDPEKVVAGTELIIGPYIPGDRFRNAAYVYGLAGEAMLNFGWFFAFVPFAIWGLLMGVARALIQQWQQNDVRQFVRPYLVLVLGLMPGGDLDNTVTGFVGKCSFVLLFVLLIASRREARLHSWSP